MTSRVMQQFDLSGRLAVITGAGGELCGTMASALAEVGVRVAILDLNEEQAVKRRDAIRQAGGTAEAFVCDVLDESAMDDVASLVEQQMGPPDFLINGAGGNNPNGSTDKDFLEKADLELPDTKTFFDLSLAGYSQTFSLNFLGTFSTTRAFARSMAERGSGVILNISSMSAMTPLTKVGAYSAAKAAVSNFTRWSAVHFAKAGLRVNAIAPGFFMTEQLKFLHIDQESGELTPRAKQVVAHTPLGRYGDPDDLVGAVVWLLSDAARFVTGAVIAIDGGFSSYAI